MTTSDLEMSSERLRCVTVALDTSDRDEFGRWCRFFGPRVGVLKVGLEAFTRWGPEAIEEARQHGNAVFADLKLHDIPNTVAGAVASIRRLGVDYLTLHAGGGSAMIRAAADAAGDEVKLLAVTLLTHLDELALQELDLPGLAEERVLAWARNARRAGAQGAVCSPRELSHLRRRLPRPFLLVTPGIRPGATPQDDDQRRVATPEEAMGLGADLLVIGRPLTRSKDPRQALEELATRVCGAVPG